MKALYYVGNRTMEMRDIPKPTVKDGQYLVQVKVNGICGSDFEGYLGKTGRRIPPMIMGHEVSGIIEEAPAGGKIRKGEHVVVFPKPFCGVCDFCKKGMVNVCPAGICMGVMDVDGSMAEYIAVDEKYLIPFGPSLSFHEASMTEPLAVAYRSVHKISDREIEEAEYCMVIGAGTIGLLVVALLKMRGAKNIIVSDATNFRLETAKKMKADHIINSCEVDFLETVKKDHKRKDVRFRTRGGRYRADGEQFPRLLAHWRNGHLDRQRTEDGRSEHAEDRYHRINN